MPVLSIYLFGRQHLAHCVKIEIKYPTDRLEKRNRRRSVPFNNAADSLVDDPDCLSHLFRRETHLYHSSVDGSREIRLWLDVGRHAILL